MNKQFAMTVPKYLNLEISIASFKYFRTVFKAKKKQICLFGFWENLRRANLLTVLSDLYHSNINPECKRDLLYRT